jgi:sulfate transport system permease protein
VDDLGRGETTVAKGKAKKILPGFGLSMGFTITYLSLIVLIPLSAVFLKTTELTWQQFIDVITNDRVVASFKVSLSTSIYAALINAVFGTIVAWVLVRYSFPFKRFVDGLIDLPFALPTAVAGIALTAIYNQNGMIGKWLAPYDIQVAYTKIGITIALIFIGLPFVVRTLQPVIGELEREVEEASVLLGASRWTTLRKVIFPQLVPALISGTSLAFARGLGEYGSVVFISGNMPFKTEIVPLMIVSKLEQFDYAGATAIALTMLVISFVMLLLINYFQWRARRKMTSL